MAYVSRLPSPPLAALVDDFYYLAGIPPYPRPLSWATQIQTSQRCVHAPLAAGQM